VSKVEATQADRKGPVQLLVGIVIHPRKAMRYLSHGIPRHWWLPALATVIVIAVSVYVHISANSNYLYRSELEWYESMTHEERGPMPTPQLRMPPTLTVGLRIGGRVVGTVFSWLIWTGALLLAVTFLGRNGATFGSLFAMVVWSWMPYVVRGILQSVFMFLSKQPIYNQGLSGFIIDNTPMTMMEGFNRHAYPMPPTMGKMALASILSKADIFLLWQLVLVAMGVVALTRLPPKKSIFVTAGVWIVVVLLGIIPVIFGNAFARFRFF
jgi:hypothetical protein